MMKVVDVSMICFKSISFKRTFKEKEFKETDEFNKNYNDDADERKQNT